jgi:hypothetical protein
VAAQGQKSSGSRKHGRNSRSGGITHSVSLYRSRFHKMKSTRGNIFSRPTGVCSNCGTKQGPFGAGPLPRLRVCKDTTDCGKRRAKLDFDRYPAVKVA